eukprot:TRINITY_DN1360_c0_g1_i4.p2 TRINITY_DN1360_c0_g1~~TRINITY_DN1360_c0_g1_i4.p2  ORF type:complete len:207 (-),score=112.30 TRINITY_DN1360_c0_g1_i4:185-775(-)
MGDDSLLFPSADITTTAFFPDSPTNQLVIGERVHILLGFVNRGDKEFNVTSIGAFLHSPYNHQYVIQNYTRREYGIVVPARTEMTFEYVFKPDPNLEPLDFGFSVDVLYNASDKMYRSVFYNGTMEFIEAPSTFDIRKVFSYFLIVSIIGLIAYLVVNATKSGKKVKSAERGTRTQAVDDWNLSQYKPKNNIKKKN